MLFSDPHRDLPGKAFRYGFESQLEASELTFAGNLEQLQNLSEILTREWSAWPTFSGLAVDGLEEIYLEQAD